MNARAKKTKPKLTADAAYENAHLVAQDLLEHIRDLLADQPAPGNDERPISWADVGTLAEVNNRLVAITAYLADSEF